ncbi:Pin family phage protein, partial [Trabulsiella guamensis ATCC 49490]
MATNDFKPFATGAGANVTSQADWESLPALPTGFTAGKASSAQVNKALRQPSTIAAMVGQFIANANLDALDNGDLDTLVENFTNSLIANLG